MKWIAPDYYSCFTCIADQCKHSCCKGWEIDIDEETFAMYQSLSGEWGEKIRKHIVITDETASFRLTEDERCPFLNECGLCDLILQFGENILCQICTDHPRFRYDYTDRTEIGLGLCCEEAARLILTQKEPVQLTAIEDDGFECENDPEEDAFFLWRKFVFSIIQNRSMPLAGRLHLLCRSEGLPNPDVINPAAFRGHLLELERMDEAWADCINHMSDGWNIPEKWEIPMEQLLVVLLYRHLPGSLDDGRKIGRLLFAVFCTLMIVSMLASCETEEELWNLVRMFSSEIEYSDENVDKLIEMLMMEFHCTEC